MNKLILTLIAIIGLVALSACSEQTEASSDQKNAVDQPLNVIFEEISWTDLEPEGQSALPQYLPEDLAGFDEDPNFNSFDLELEANGGDSIGGLSLPQPYLNTAKAIPEMDGRAVKIPGFVVPLELDDNLVTEFFLVPYFGACFHKPPPPPNQIIYITSEKGIEVNDIYAPIWVKGLIETEQKGHELAMSLYSMKLQASEEFYW